MMSTYFRNAVGALLVYDVTVPESFEGIETWRTELMAVASPKTEIALVGNKIDLRGRRVDRNKAERYAQQKGMLTCETSAKTGENVYQTFLDLAERIHKNAQNDGSNNKDAFQLMNDDDMTQGDCGQQCCG
eukprot:CAMPEP_0113939560 /NCGR_PEP_ID=MMETSP1339-20121228/5859_1 /TAXON_ID=94617 /ORGANISM="Fibrocapsa japonica" /LENGTH=130 /DNA_ID=CAMNT_0000943101 /DNA_START=1 /DNA_END=393 /DNA_ORIENTATION=+ /assembly_acc=CAM_ASM_000762